MAGYQDCIDAIRSSAGDLTDDEIEELFTELDARVRERERIGEAEGLDDAVLGAADDYAAEMVAAAKIQKRNAALQLKTYLETLDKVRSTFAADPGGGLESALVGRNAAVTGSRRSAAGQQRVLLNRYLSVLYSELRRANVEDMFNSGALDAQAARALWALNRAEPIPSGVAPEAEAIARAVSEAQELARVHANAAGAWIKRLEGYITRQSHDAFRISRAAGAGATGDEHFRAWRDFILPRLDLARTLGDRVDTDEFLRAAFRGIVSGDHVRTIDQGGFRGPANIAKRLSQERVLHFKSPEAWVEYNQRFGRGSLRESAIAALSQQAQNTGLMRFFGPNPEANFNRLVDTLARDIKDEAALARFRADANGYLRNRFDEVSGLTRIPVNHIAASAGSSWRALQNMAHLGASLLAQFGDVPLFGTEMRYQGHTMLSGVARSIQGMGERVNAPERLELWSSLDVYFESMGGGIMDKFSLPDDGLPGMLAKTQMLFFKLNGMRAWSERQRAAALQTFSHHLALNSGKDFGALAPELQRVLDLYGIGERQWRVLRQATEMAEDGRQYLTPTAVERIADSEFETFLRNDGINPTPRRIATAREEIADQLRSYYIDRAEYAQLQPDARTRSTLNQGTRPGTAIGELDRFIGQFKSFSFAVVQKSLGRELYGRGAPVDATFVQALRSGNGELLGLANIIAYSAVFGYGAMVAKDLVKGRTPRDPLSVATFGAALAQGGGLGIYGDFLFGQANRFGGGLIQTLAGPSLGDAEDIYKLYATLIDPTQTNRASNAAAQAFRFGLNNTPYVNLFYTRIVLDYLILWRIQEAMSPGSLRRMERRVERENNQTFTVRPSRYYRRGEPLLGIGG